MNRWLPLAFGVLLFNGIVLTLQNLLPVKYTDHFLTSAFFVSSLICWAFVAAGKKRPRFHDLAVGAVAGVISYIGNTFLIKCLSLGKASLIFPVVLGSSMVLVTLVSAIIFKERLSPRGILALIVGIASAVILKLS